MNSFKFFSICLAVFSSSVMLAQQPESEVFLKPAPITYLDSIKQSFVNYETSNCIDERWMNELTNQELFKEMYADVTKNDIDANVDYNELSTEVLKERLKYLDQKSPFNIQHNQALENVIKSFLKNRSKSFERLMALSEYYFPMFEEHLSKYNLPLEIKYLAIVESALNPHAKSHVGATGLWQFMYATGKQYNLEVNSYVDERYDPLKATDAACQYFTNMYKIFGDWDLVLASYNTGPGNVSKAIRRSGGLTNYWNIRPYLHKETQGYLPAFLATMYIYEFHKDHGINPKKAPLSFFETDTVMIKKKMNFDQISDLLDIPVSQIKFLNPIYKVQVIPFVEDTPHYLRLPKDKLAIFQSNEKKIYAYIDHVDGKREKPFDRNDTKIVSNSKGSRIVTKIKYHKVRKGESLSTIASKNNVSVSQLKKWNNIKGSIVNAGKNLKIQTTTRVAGSEPKEDVAQNVLENNATVSSTTKKSDKKIEHVIQRGESLDIISAKYNVSVSDLKSWNNLNTSKIIAGKILNIDSNSSNLDTKIETYIVKSGDTLSKIASKTGVTISQIKSANNLKSEKLKPGQVLKING